MMSVPKQRPIGITILAVLFFLTGAIDGLGILYMVLKMFSSDLRGAIVYIGLTIYLFAMATGLVGEGLALVVPGIGLMRLQNWARVLTIALIGVVGLLIAPRALRLIFGNRPIGSVGLIVALAIVIWVFIYLFKPHVKQAFGATGL
jgi:hypothetical protein